MTRWQGGAALFFLSILFTGLCGHKPQGWEDALSAWLGGYFLLILPAGVGYAMRAKDDAA